VIRWALATLAALVAIPLFILFLLVSL